MMNMLPEEMDIMEIRDEWFISIIHRRGKKDGLKLIGQILKLKILPEIQPGIPLRKQTNG